MNRILQNIPLKNMAQVPFDKLRARYLPLAEPAEAKFAPEY